MSGATRYKNRHPWARNYFQARRRCNDPKHDSYQWYGARGIKCELTMEQAKILWMRDRADQMDKPSLDRINPDKNYSFDNCRFIEFTVNSSARRTKFLVSVRRYEKRELNSLRAA